MYIRMYITGGLDYSHYIYIYIYIYICILLNLFQLINCCIVFTVYVSIIKKITIPDNWQYEEARKLFTEPEVLDSKDIVVSILIPLEYLSQ